MEILPSRFSFLNSKYNLNYNRSKFLTIGLKEDAELESFEPTIDFGSSSQEITLSLEDWRLLKDNFGEISTFLNESKNLQWRNPIAVTNKLSIIFTCSFQSKSVIIEKSNFVTRGSDKPDAKRQHYVPSVTIKKVTFDNLKNICGLVDSKIKYLQEISFCVYHCKEFLENYFSDKEDEEPEENKSSLKETVVKELLKNQSDEKIVKNALVFDLIFDELYFYYK